MVLDGARRVRRVDRYHGASELTCFELDGGWDLKVMGLSLGLINLFFSSGEKWKDMEEMVS